MPTRTWMLIIIVAVVVAVGWFSGSRSAYFERSLNQHESRIASTETSVGTLKVSLEETEREMRLHRDRITELEVTVRRERELNSAQQTALGQAAESLAQLRINAELQASQQAELKSALAALEPRLARLEQLEARLRELESARSADSKEMQRLVGVIAELRADRDDDRARLRRIEEALGIVPAP